MSGPLPPGLRRNMVTICAMTATIMQALDTTIANVALPYMQGTLSASQDQINWVLTSYIVAAAIMTAPVGWIANRYGRKRIFIIGLAGFADQAPPRAVGHQVSQVLQVLGLTSSLSLRFAVLSLFQRFIARCHACGL